jgi:hypothetical protein
MGARLVAYFSTGGTFLSPRFMIVLWFISQCVRLVVLRSVADIASLPLLTTGSLIALDKWSGSLGEIALEASLLNLLATHNEKQTRPGIFTMASTTLMCLVAPLESLNGSSAKMIARSAYGTSVPMIVLLSLVPVGCVWRWSERKMRE